MKERVYLTILLGVLTTASVARAQEASPSPVPGAAITGATMISFPPWPPRVAT